jgi:hypothetical protein
MDDAIVGAASTTLLDYAMETAPSPLQVSLSETDPTVAEIQIAVSNGSEKPIYAESITFTIPVGEAAQDLVSPKQVSNVKPAITPSDQWEINPGAEVGEFIASPKKPEYGKVTKAGLLVQLRKISVNEEVGTFVLMVAEMASKQDSGFTEREGEYKLAKFPYGFNFLDFRPEKPQIGDGEEVTLEWVGSDDATYTLLYGSASPEDVTLVRRWTPKTKFHTDTTFILKAAVQVKDEPSLEHYLSTTVTVANPEIEATSLKVTGETTLEGATTVGAGATPPPLNVNGPLKAAQNVEAGGALNAASLGLTGGATITGALGVHGAFQALAGVSMHLLGSPQAQSAGTYVAPCDGFAFGRIYGAGIDPSTKCIGWISAYYGGGLARATGGNLISWLDVGTWSTDWIQANFDGSLLLPVPAGVTYTLSFQAGSEIDANPGYEFVWIPMANSGGGDVDAPERVGDVDAMPAPPPPQAVHRSARGFAGPFSE